MDQGNVYKPQVSKDAGSLKTPSFQKATIAKTPVEVEVFYTRFNNSYKDFKNDIKAILTQMSKDLLP